MPLLREVGVSDPETFLACGILKPTLLEYDQKYVDLSEEAGLGL